MDNLYKWHGISSLEFDHNTRAFQNIYAIISCKMDINIEYSSLTRLENLYSIDVDTHLS